MFFASHFGLVEVLGSAIKTSLSEISESVNSLVSSLAINGCGDEEDLPTSIVAKGSSSN